MSARQIARPDPLWRMTQDGLEPLTALPHRYESDLESLIAATPELLGEKTLVIGRQVTTPDGKILDLLRLRSDGTTILTECKKERAEYNALGQLIVYGAWIDTLDRPALEAIFAAYMQSSLGPKVNRVPTLEEAFAAYFGTPLPAILNRTQTMELAALRVDAHILKAIKFLEKNNLPISVHIVGTFKYGNETLVSSTEWVDVDAARERPISVSAQLHELRIATVAAVEQGTSRLLEHISQQRPPRADYGGPFFTKGAHGDVLCFAQLFMPRFTTTFVPYPLLDALYDWWVNEQASVGVERIKPAHNFARQLKNAIKMVGGWSWRRKFWDEDPSLENERLRLLAGNWTLPARGQHLSGYVRDSWS